MNNISIKKIFTFWLVPVFLVGFWILKDVVLAFLAGILIGSAIRTAALFLQYKLHFNYYLSVFLIYVLLILLISLMIYVGSLIIIDQIPQIIKSLDKYSDYRYADYFVLPKLSLLTGEIKKYLRIDDKDLTAYFQRVISFISNFLGSLLSIVLIFVVSLYVAFTKNFIYDFFNFLPNHKLHYYNQIWRHLQVKISFWFVGEFILMLFIGVATYIFMGLILQIKYAAFIALMAGLLEILPIIGPLFTLIFATLITLVEQPDSVFFVVGFFIIIQQLENHLLVPIIMKKAMSLNPLLIIFGIIAGGKFFGILGIITIVPLLGLLLEIIKIYNDAGSSKGRTHGSGP